MTKEEARQLVINHWHQNLSAEEVSIVKNDPEFIEMCPFGFSEDWFIEELEIK